MNSNTTAAPAFEGTLALASERPRFRVIEGGLSKQAQKAPVHVPAKVAVARPRSARRLAPAQATAQVRRTSTQAQPSSSFLVVCAVSLMVAIALLWFVPNALAKSRVSHALEGVTYETVTVHTGDTLWGIAEEHAVEGCTTAEVVQHIKSANELEDACLAPGMRISVPCTLG